jgi:hypothetical protein
VRGNRSKGWGRARCGSFSHLLIFSPTINLDRGDFATHLPSPQLTYLALKPFKVVTRATIGKLAPSIDQPWRPSPRPVSKSRLKAAPSCSPSPRASHLVQGKRQTRNRTHSNSTIHKPFGVEQQAENAKRRLQRHRGLSSRAALGLGVPPHQSVDRLWRHSTRSRPSAAVSIEAFAPLHPSRKSVEETGVGPSFRHE